MRAWLVEDSANHGLAIASVADRTVDDGFSTRFQIYGSEHSQAKVTPKLTVRIQP